MTAQSDKIAQLSAEVDTLKTALGGPAGPAESEKDERIAALERELEGLRSGD